MPEYVDLDDYADALAMSGNGGEVLDFEEHAENED